MSFFLAFYGTTGYNKGIAQKTTEISSDNYFDLDQREVN
jgi:hypothetical protein